ICNDFTRTSDVLSIYSNKLVKDAIKGSEIWNVRSNVSVNGILGDDYDPWDVTNSGTAMSQVDTASTSFHFKKLRQGLEVVNHINQLGLAMKNADESFQNWKMFFSAGSDAHGSFNYSNTENFAGIGSVVNTAVGKLNTLAYCPNGMGTNGSEVLRALYYGNISMSDGPILNMGISTDGDNTVNEIIMGEDAWIDPMKEDDIHVNFNYITTPEFGDVTSFTFIAGTDSGEVRKTIALPAVSGNNEISFKLIDLLDSLFGVGNTPVGSYMYIRAELETFVDYSSMTSIYRTNYDIFHGLTNPIWIRWETPLYDGPEEFTIYPNPTADLINVALGSTHDYTTYSLYNAIGQVVKSGEIVTNPISIDMSIYGAGVYTIKVWSDAGATAAGKVVKLSD
ncbi:MAG: T9SS type A sorting domain-containing protein, partial [Flavobacteriales bacterium]|nr:T9SS type A sorting domain-containing protein [Flavobacteriales bacterium]